MSDEYNPILELLHNRLTCLAVCPPAHLPAYPHARFFIYLPIFFLAYILQVNSFWLFFFTQTDWFLYLRISCTIYLRAKQDGDRVCFCYERINFFSINETAVPHNTKIATKFGNKSFKHKYFFHFLAIDVVKKCSIRFVYK